MQFYRNLLILSFLVLLALAGFYLQTGYEWIHPLAWYILLFFAGVSGLTYFVIQKGFGQEYQDFQLYYFGSSVFRMLLCMLVVFLYVFLARERELQFAANFFVIYFIYTGFEIYSIVSNLRRISKK